LFEDERVEKVSLELSQVQLELLLHHPLDFEPVSDVQLGSQVGLKGDFVEVRSCVLEPSPAGRQGWGAALEAPLVLVVLEKAECLANACSDGVAMLVGVCSLDIGAAVSFLDWHRNIFLFEVLNHWLLGVMLKVGSQESLLLRLLGLGGREQAKHC